MELIKILDRLKIELNDTVVIYDQNITSPLYLGYVGNVTFEYLRRTVKTIEFQAGSDTYKGEELFYMFKITLKS